MWRLILFLIFLVASVWLGQYVLHHPGYVFLVYQPWMIQTPLWFFILCLFVFLGVFYLLMDSVDRFQFLLFRFKNWLRFRKEHHSYSKMQQGLSALIEGQWKKAERLLLTSAHQTGEPLINYLGAAKAAHEEGAFDKRDQYLRRAHNIAPHADLSVGLVQAELSLAQDQLEQTIAILNRLRQISPKHPRILKLLEKTYVKMADWKNLEALLPSLRKAKILTKEQMEQFEKNMYCEILRTSNHKTLAALHQYWDTIPKPSRKNPDVLYVYLLQLKSFSDIKTIEQLIHQALKNNWHAGLVEIYSSLPVTQVNQQLVIVGAWLKMYGEHASLLCMLGRLCVQAQLWGKAKDYFERCLAIAPHPEASLHYGKLLEYLGDQDKAMQIYREGLGG